MAMTLKVLFIQSEINRINSRITQYNEIYHSAEIKDLNLRRLIANKQREKDILETMLKGKENNE